MSCAPRRLGGRRELAKLSFDLFARVLFRLRGGESEGDVLADGAEALECDFGLGVTGVAARHRLDQLQAHLHLAIVLRRLAHDAREVRAVFQKALFKLAAVRGLKARGVLQSALDGDGLASCAGHDAPDDRVARRRPVAAGGEAGSAP